MFNLEIGKLRKLILYFYLNDYFVNYLIVKKKKNTEWYYI